MLKVTILQIGKTKDPALQSLLDEYAKRMRSSFALDMVTVKDESALWKQVDGIAYTVALEAHGKTMDSPAFAAFLHDAPLKGHSHIRFLIGPAEGFSSYARKPDLLLSLSAMTFSHQTIRLLLLEQLYRAATVLEGKPFAK